MSANSTWKPAYDCSFIHNGVTFLATTAEFSESDATFETTNTASGGAYEFGVAEATYSVRGTVPVDSSNPQLPRRRTLVAMSFSDGIETHSGQGRITRRSKKGGGKGGYMVDFEATFSGAVTVS